MSWGSALSACALLLLPDYRDSALLVSGLSLLCCDFRRDFPTAMDSTLKLRVRTTPSFPKLFLSGYVATATRRVSNPPHPSNPSSCSRPVMRQDTKVEEHGQRNLLTSSSKEGVCSSKTEGQWSPSQTPPPNVPLSLLTRLEAGNLMTQLPLNSASSWDQAFNT